MAFSPFTLKNNSKGVIITDSSSNITFNTTGYTLPLNVTDGPFLVTIEEEIVKVTNVVDSTSHYTLSTTRAQEGTTYASHATDTTGGLLITAGILDNMQDYISLIDTTSNIDLNSMDAAVALNTAKVTNATHSGEMTGATTLTADPTLISNKTGVTPAAGDYVLILDADDNLLKKSLVDTFISAGGAGDVSGPASSLLNSIAIFDSTTGKHIDDSLITIDTTGNINVPGSMTASKQIKNTSQYSLTPTTGAVTWNINDYPSAKLIPTGNVTLTISGVALNSNASLYFVQDSSSAKTVTWDGAIIWSGGYAPDLSTLSSKHLFNFFSFDGTGIYGAYISNTNRSVVENSGGTTVANAIAIFDSTTGGLIKDSAATMDVSGNLAGLTSINATSISNYLTTDSTSTMTNKRNTMRVQTISDSTSISFNSDLYDAGKVTLAGNRTLAAPTGTPTNFQLFELQVAQDATGTRTLTFIDTTGANSYRVGTDLTGISLSTVANKKDYLLFQYSSDVTGWNYLAINKGF